MKKLTENELVDIRRALHQIPEIGLQEVKTHQFLMETIQKITENCPNVSLKTWHTGILVYIRGTKGKQTIGWRTDIDALPVTEETGLPFASKREGFMHACGHDMHMTIALGVLSHIVERKYEENLLILFQPAEENEAGGMLMYEDGAFGEWLPDEFYALHVLPALPTGVIATRCGTLFASTCEVKITVNGKSGHAAFPHQAIDPIVAASQLITQAQTIVSRNVDPMNSAVITFGSIHGGVTHNVIAQSVDLFGTIRTLTQEQSQFVQKRLRALCLGVEQSFGVEISCHLDQKGYYPVENDRKLAEKFIDFMQTQPEIAFEDIEAAMTGEDFGYLLHKTRGVMFWLGVNSPYPLHHSQMTPDEAALSKGVFAVTSWLDERAKCLTL